MMSNPGMDNTQHIHRRITELEIKVSFQEDQLDQLNAVVVRQQQEIALLLRDVQQLRQLAGQNNPDGASQATRQARDERPPHY
jgi:SlyX protein